MRLGDLDELIRKGTSTFDESIPIADFIDLADSMPTIEVEPVRHGKWIIRDNPGTGWYRITCSECGEDVTSTAPCIGFLPNAKVNWDYCPDCGAKMLDTLNEVTE